MKIFLVIIFFAMVWASPANAAPLDSFVRCLKDKGAVFYGAYWCPYCRNQKAMFGRSQKLLPYVECSEQSTKSERVACRGILGFPTWKFADGSRLMGELPLGMLAEKMGCKLPKSQ
ncbi:MAG: hypothetical protein HZC03_00215 [Candidatus Lloydbacteria bacterium]|nr:hypothetical protein [Candidatus Lloydbacteria bacterium]